MPTTSGSAIYVKFDGIDGECTDGDHKKWCEVSSMSHNIQQPTSGASASGTVVTGQAAHSDFVVTKLIDISSPKLNQYCCSGKEVKNIKIEVIRPSGDSRVKLYAVEMDKAIISSIALATNPNGERPGEVIGIRYKSIKWTYSTGDGNTTAGFNLEEHKVS